jgi:hypothetical protein
MVKRVFILMVVVLCFGSCRDLFLGEDPGNTPRINFEYLWKTLDEKYSFFSYKKVNWDSIYQIYSPKVSDTLNDIELFSICFDMLSELRDSHVNLTSPFNVSRYDKQFLSSPENFDNNIVQSSYLKNNYFVTGPFKHQTIASGNIGYVRYSSFMDDISAENMDFVVSRYNDKKGLIIDVRSNGGGTISNMFTLCSHFADERRHVYTSYLKKGPGHDNFFDPNEVYISPSGNKFTKKICILTNRGCYSATSFFVLAMRNFPLVTIVGDTTGGGLGAPTGCELPNGWALRFSASKTLSPEGENFEDGIPPDIAINMKESDRQKKKDSIIEKAISIILSDN